VRDDRTRRLAGLLAGYETRITVCRGSPTINFCRIERFVSRRPRLSSVTPRAKNVSPVRKRLGPDVVELVAVDDDWALRNVTSGATVVVSPFEARCFSVASEERLREFFFARGGAPGLRGTEHVLSQVAAGLAHGLPLRDELACLTDATTVGLSRFVVEESDLVIPAALLDLATLAFVVVMYDTVVVDDEATRVPPMLDDVFRRARLRKRNQSHIHFSYAADIHNTLLFMPEALDEASDAWSRFLRTDVRVSYAAMDSMTRSPGSWPFLPGEIFGTGYDPIALGTAPVGRLDVTGEVSVQSFRYFLNDRTAGVLGLPYHCTSLRYPIQRGSLRRRATYRWLADELLSQPVAARGYTKSSAPHEPFVENVQLPGLLSVVLHRASSREHIWAELLQLREEFTAVREWMAAAAQEGVSRQGLYELMSRVTAPGNGRSFDALVSNSSSVASALPIDGGVASVGLKLTEVMKVGRHLSTLTDWVRRPEVGVLRSFNGTVAELHHGMDDITRLWGMELSRGWFDNARRLDEQGSLSAAQFRASARR
jgi:hypothetical protein